MCSHVNLNYFYNLLSGFEKFILNDSVKENLYKEENRPLKHFISSVNEDLHAIYVLLQNSHLIQAQKLVRHTFETMVLLVYLDKYSKEYSKEDHLADSEICDLGKEFTSYRLKISETKDFNDYLNFLNKRTKDRLKQYINNSRMNKNCKEILSELPELSDNNVNCYDNFWRNFKPKFMEIHSMLTSIEKSGANSELIGLLRYNYNLYSQVAHNKLSLQIDKVEYKENELVIFYNFCKTIINVTCRVLIDNKIIPDNSYVF